MNRQYAALSGGAVVLIALNHAIHFGFEMAPVGGTLQSVLIALQALGAFAVPAFLFISGAFLSYSAGQLSMRFLRTNLERILWPYLSWSIAFYALVFVTTGEGQSLAGYAKSLLVGYPYHFVPLLVFWYAVAPLVVKFGRRHGLLLLAGIGAYQSLLLLLRFPEIAGGWAVPDEVGRLLKVPILFTSMSDWAIYFPLGVVVSMHQAAIRTWLVRLRWLLAAAAGALFVAGVLNAVDVVSAPVARLVVPLPVMLLLPLVNRASIPMVRSLESLGRCSYGIYLAHFFVINVTVFIVANAGVNVGAIRFPLLLAIALALPLGLMNLITRVPSARHVYRYVFGIAPPADRARPSTSRIATRPAHSGHAAV
jgi:surface polysaccharide O-acyltransferase-like enzyme